MPPREIGANQRLEDIYFQITEEEGSAKDLYKDLAKDLNGNMEGK